MIAEKKRQLLKIEIEKYGPILININHTVPIRDFKTNKFKLFYMLVTTKKKHLC